METRRVRKIPSETGKKGRQAEVLWVQPSVLHPEVLRAAPALLDTATAAALPSTALPELPEVL